MNGIDVLFAAVLIGYPLALAPAIIQIQHRGDRVHAQPVGVILIQPEQGIADKKTLHFAASVIESQRTPVGVFAQPRIGMLVKVSAVEVTKSGLVFLEVSRHPIENHSDATLMEIIHEEHEIGRSSKRARRGKITDGLIAACSLEWMLRHRNGLHM